VSTTHPLDGMYQEILLEHSRDPHNFGEMNDSDLKAEGYNPLCGDKICMQLKLSTDEKAQSVRFKGEACSICMASASILTDEIQNHTLGEIQTRVSEFRDLMQGKKSPDDFDGDISSLAGVRNFPVRIKCALLPWTTLNEAIDRHTEKRKEGV